MGRQLYINGAWRAPHAGGSFDVIDPATEEVIDRVAAGTAADVNDAVVAARAAFDSGPWSRCPGRDRAEILRRIAAFIRRDADELARLESRDNGKPLPEAAWDIADAAGCFDYYADLADTFDTTRSEDVALPDARFRCQVVREPLGVAGAIIPWNYPLLMAAWKVAPALAAGCTLVLKPSEFTPLTACELGRIADEVGLPPGVLNIVTGLGADAGQPLSSHPGIDKLAFTGSVPTGSKIMREAARDIKNISLELGGKSPFLVFADADIAQAVEWIMFGIFWNQGQVCSATSRVLVEQSLYPQLIERLVAETEKIRIGNGLEAGTLLGPLVSRSQFDKVAAAIDAARRDGARVATGGGPAPGFNKGYFFAPTVLTDMPVTSAAWREEIFGPVVCVRPFAHEDEALALANDSPFGLAAAVMSRDIARADRVAGALRAGIVWINCSQPTFTEAPWGGYKQSGIGRELGRWGFENYLETKQITRYTSQEPWGWYIK